MSSKSYQTRNDFRDSREFTFGSVWKVVDDEVVIPYEDRLGTRKLHAERWVVVISNNEENYHPLCPVVTVAPLSHRVELKRHNDLDLSSQGDSVKVDCLLQLKLSQPIIKKELYDFKGEISDPKKVELQVLLESFYGLTDEEEE